MEAICRSEALKIYVCNIMTQEGETEGYTAADHVDALLSHGGAGAGGPVPGQLGAGASRPGGEVPGRRRRPHPGGPGAHPGHGAGAGGVSGGLGGGDYARHDPDRLAAAVLDVYRRRAVRIFRGEQRYIIEE